jgi:D-alanyl-D-alanine carboxypeptidase
MMILISLFAYNYSNKGDMNMKSFVKSRKHLTLVTATCLSLGVNGVNAVDADVINTVPLYSPSPHSAFQNTLTVPLFRTFDEGLHSGTLGLDWSNQKFWVEEYQLIDQFSDAYQADPDFPADVAENLANYVDALIGDDTGGLGKTGGIVIRVDIGESSWRGAKGYSQLDSCCKKHRVYSNKFRMASVSKVYTGTLMMSLVEEGIVNLDDTLEKWFSDESWYNKLPDGSITVEELLGMRSGLSDYTHTPEFAKIMACTPLKVFTPEELLLIGFGFDEGTQKGKFFYSNTNYILLGLLIEKATNKPGLLEQVLNDRILEPLGLFNTALPEDSGIPYYFDKGYTFNFGDDNTTCAENQTYSSLPSPKETTTMPEGSIMFEATYLSPTWLWTTGGMLTNVADFSKAIKAQVKGEIVPPLSQSVLDDRYDRQVEMFTPEQLFGFTGCEGGINYGLAIIEHNGYLGHDGEIAGYNSAAFYNPQKDIALALNINNYPGLELDWQALNVALNVINVIEKGEPCRSPETRTRTRDGRTPTEIKFSIPLGGKYNALRH